MSKKIIFFVVLIDLLGFGIMIPMLPFYARSFGASATQVGLLMFVYSFIQIFSGPVWGRFSDRHGRRPILLLTILGQALAMIWAGFAGSYFMLLISRMAAGLFAGNISTATAYMADITPQAERARGMGIIGAAFGLGFVFGPAIGGFLIHYGYYWPSLFAGILGVVNFFWAFRALQEPAIDVAERAEHRNRLRADTLKKTLSAPRVLTPIVLFSLLTLAFVNLEVTFGLFVLDRFEFDERHAGYLLAMMGLMMAIVQGGLIGRLTKRFHERYLVAIGVVFILAGLAVIIGVHQVGYLVGGLALLATGYGLTNPCLSALTSKAAARELQGSILGVYQSGGSLARVLGPLAAGFLYDKNLVYPFVAAWCIGFLAFLGALSMVWFLSSE